MTIADKIVSLIDQRDYFIAKIRELGGEVADNATFAEIVDAVCALYHIPEHPVEPEPEQYGEYGIAPASLAPTSRELHLDPVWLGQGDATWKYYENTSKPEYNRYQRRNSGTAIPTSEGGVRFRVDAVGAQNLQIGLYITGSPSVAQFKLYKWDGSIWRMIFEDDGSGEIGLATDKRITTKIAIPSAGYYVLELSDSPIGTSDYVTYYPSDLMFV